jgi:hypothetical protein
MMLLFAGNQLSYGPFSIDRSSGIITLVGSLEKSRVTYRLDVAVTDDGRCCGSGVSRMRRGTVIVEVRDINNNAPRFPDCASYAPVVMEKENVGISVIQVWTMACYHCNWLAKGFILKYKRNVARAS